MNCAKENIELDGVRWAWLKHFNYGAIFIPGIYISIDKVADNISLCFDEMQSGLKNWKNVWVGT